MNEDEYIVSAMMGNISQEVAYSKYICKRLEQLNKKIEMIGVWIQEMNKRIHKIDDSAIIFYEQENKKCKEREDDK